MSTTNSNTTASIAYSMALKTALLDEKNTMKCKTLAPCCTEENKKQKDEYFLLISRKQLHRAQERFSRDEELLHKTSGQPASVFNAVQVGQESIYVLPRDTLSKEYEPTSQ